MKTENFEAPRAEMGCTPSPPAWTGYAGSLGPPKPLRKPPKPKLPLSLRQGRPDAVVLAVMKLVARRSAARPADQYLTFTCYSVLEDIGVEKELRGKYGHCAALCRGTLIGLGLHRGTRGLNVEVFRLPPGHQPLMGQLFASSNNAPARRCNTGPEKAEDTQRRLAAEKCAKPGRTAP